MSTIRATYRLQLRGGVGFADAAALAPHLAAAGLSHLYVSPPFTAVSGSGHGYDVTNPAEFDPALGGADGFAAMADALAAVGVGLVVDIVPNHMAAHPENGWWWDVMRHGQGSRYARHFDIDWAAGRLTLPILAAPLAEVLAAGEIRRGVAPDGAPVVHVPGHTLPLAPGTEGIEPLEACLAAQHYRLVYWRYGRDALTYRRFFEINELAGLRVEDPAVFADVHRLVLAEVAAGRIQGLRVDHVDGLADPVGYLGRLAGAVSVPVLVEKICEPGEDITAWATLGTTGYEVIAGLADLFTDPDGFAALSEGYAAIAPEPIDAMALGAKLRIIEYHLAAEVSALVALAQAAFAATPEAQDFGPDTLRRAIVGLLAGMPVYRTYGVARALNDADREHLAHARAHVPAEALIIEDEGVVDHLLSLFERGDGAACRFVTKFQQTSGPVMAKSVEDTLFYRHLRLLALNEVGGSLTPSTGAGRLIGALSAGGLASTQTHDTKRGEDARARLYALSDPAAAALWADVWPRLGGEGLPDKWRWGLAQMAFASRPLGDVSGFAERLRAAALKSVREAKEETSWTRGDAAFEDAIVAHAEALGAELFEALEKVRRAGAVLGLGQALLKGMGRRAPDIYQGTFGWDFSMVDPDNRRPVDSAAEVALCERARGAALDDLVAHWTDGAAKARVLLAMLGVRAEAPDAFDAGQLSQLPIDGPLNDVAVAIALSSGGTSAVAVVVTRPLGLLGNGISVRAPDGRLNLSFGGRERISGTPFRAGPVELAPFLSRFPAALLVG